MQPRTSTIGQAGGAGFGVTGGAVTGATFRSAFVADDLINAIFGGGTNLTA